MQLDKTRVVVRERGYADRLDLSLLVIKAYILPLLIASLMGALPFVAFNAWLLHNTVDIPTSMSWDSQNLEPLLEALPAIFFYAFLYMILMYLEIPLATAGITLFLGDAFFLQQPSTGRLVRAGLRALPQILILQVIPRSLCLLPWMLTFWLPHAFWPYLNEIILLERNPLSSRRPQQVSTFRRSADFHRPTRGDLFGCWLLTLVAAALLLAVLYSSVIMCHSTLFGASNLRAFATIDFPLALWGVVHFFAVFRFLNYLDLRIRQEGWELELILRAEGQRWTKQVA